MTKSNDCQKIQSSESHTSIDEHLQTSGAQASGVLVQSIEDEKPGFHGSRTCKIICDSCGDFAPQVLENLDVECIKFSYFIDSHEYVDDIWQSIDAHTFYEMIAQGKIATTAAVSPGMYYQIFEQYAQQNIPCIYFGFTAGLSSSIHNAQTAKQMIEKDYPGYEMYVLDNLLPSASAELLVMEAARLASQGFDAQELYHWAQDARYYVHGYFTLDSFDTLARGGRIPAAAAQAGGKLDIKPELTYDLGGSLVLKKMCRGRKKALRAMLDEFKENCDPTNTYPIAIVDSDAPKDAQWLEAQIRKDKLWEDSVIIHSSVSPVIGSHTGPGMVAICFWGNDRREKLSLTDRIAHRVKKSDGQKKGI